MCKVTYVLALYFRYGFVGFHTPEAAKEQVKKNGMEIRRRKLFIDFDSSRQQCKIYSVCVCVCVRACACVCVCVSVSL